MVLMSALSLSWSACDVCVWFTLVQWPVATAETCESHIEQVCRTRARVNLRGRASAPRHSYAVKDRQLVFHSFKHLDSATHLGLVLSSLQRSARLLDTFSPTNTRPPANLLGRTVNRLIQGVAKKANQTSLPPPPSSHPSYTSVSRWTGSQSAAGSRPSQVRTMSGSASTQRPLPRLLTDQRTTSRTQTPLNGATSSPLSAASLASIDSTHPIDGTQHPHRNMSIESGAPVSLAWKV
jgi:hypothetical protein